MNLSLTKKVGYIKNQKMNIIHWLSIEKWRFLKMHARINDIIVIYITLILISISVPESWGSSLRFKLKMSGYSDHQIESILRGQKTLRQVQHENKSSLTASPSVSQKNYPRKHLHPLVSRHMNAYLQKYHANTEEKDAGPLSSEHVRQSIKERFFYHKKPLKYELIQQIRYNTQNTQQNFAEQQCHPIIEKAKPYLNYVEDASYLNNIKKSLILAVIKVESGFNHRAVSPKGAQGLMQLMPFTAKSLGVTNPFDPMQNIHGGTRYLSQCIKKLRNIKLALAAYNAGITRVAKLCKIPPYRETQNFVKKVLRYEKMYDQMIQNL